MDFEPLSVNSLPVMRRALAGTSRGVVAPTSGSTGEPRPVLLTSEAIRASVAATHETLGGPGQWLLALPADRIAGAMVLARSVIAGTEPVTLAPGSFALESFIAATGRLDAGQRRYVSLVPTQFERLMAHPSGKEALAVFDAVLVGGAPALRSQLPANVVLTYGSTETAGGCVYNGRPLPGAEVDIVDGRVRLSGPMLAEGYQDGRNDAFLQADGKRWFVTSDIGEWAAGGKLRVLGRADDVIISGGFKVHPAAVERALHKMDWIAEAVAAGVPDPMWGERVVAVVVPREGADLPEWEDTKVVLGADLQRFEIPRGLVVVNELPRLESGKIDRNAVRQIAVRASGGS